MEIILHIGTDKTGSTAIQNALSRNRHWFLSHAVYIPNTGFGRANGHAQLLSTLDPGLLQSLAAELGEAQRQGYKSALLSWEGMTRFNRGQIRKLHSALSGHSTRILVYLREQAEVIQSGHLQWVKMSPAARDIKSIARPKGPLQKIAAALFLRHPGRNYHRTLKRWRRNAPNADFTVRIFDRAQLVEGDIICDFLHQLPLQPREDLDTGEQVTNPSLDVEGALLVQRWRKDPEIGHAIDGLIDVTQSVINCSGMSSKYFLDEKAVSVIREHFRKSNENLARDFLDGDEFPFPNPSACWLEGDFSELEAQSAELLEKVKEVNKTPTLDGVAHGGDVCTQVALVEGWSKPEDWGVWSVGEESVIRFRPYAARLLGEVHSVLISIRGSYHGDNKDTRVIINGVDFQDSDLATEHADFVLSTADLGPHQSIEITLKHKNPISPFALAGKKDNRPLAFAMTAVGYKLISQ